MADTPRITVGRVEPFGPRHQAVQLAPERPQLGDAAVEFCGPGPQEVEDMTAGCVTFVPQGHDAANLPQGKAHRLGGADEGETVQHRGGVIPIARRRALRRRSRPMSS